MTIIQVKEIDKQLRDLLRRLKSGEEIVFEDEGKPVARLLPYEPGSRLPGNDAGTVIIHANFDDPLPEFER